MKIIYNPLISGQTYLELGKNNVKLSCQVLETQGLLQQLALHAGVHVEIPSYVKRLASYHRGLMSYDRMYPNNMFHRSIAIDSMGVAKTLMRWRDALVIAGWGCDNVGISDRLDALAMIEANQDENEGSLALLLKRMVERLTQMQAGIVTVPLAYKELEVEVVCPKEMFPDYLIPVFNVLEHLAKKVTYGTVDTAKKPRKMSLIEFTDQYKAEAWLAMQDADKYEVWLNTDNKRLDNWLHMTGHAVAGSEMMRSNPQITQLFLLAIQLFQRPLNVNTLLQYLYLPECPLPWKLSSRLASMIVREGGFASDKVLECITDYLEHEFINDSDKETQPEFTPEQRKEQYSTYLPFNLLDADDTQRLTEENDKIDVKRFTAFLKSIKSYADNRAVKLMAVRPDDLRIAQLQDVVAMVDALQEIMAETGDEVRFSTLQQWAQSLYETSNYNQYNAQVGCRNIISSSANMVSNVKTAVWCDFYGDVDATLSTDFLSVIEYEAMLSVAIRLWDKEKEKAFRSFVLAMPVHQTSELLTFVICKKLGATDLPKHPLSLQLPNDIEVVCGDNEFDRLPSHDIDVIDNRREEDAREVRFDANEHHVTWRNTESFSSLSDLLQNPLDYFMNYTLGFSDRGPTEINMMLTQGNVAHETIEMLFTTYRTDIINNVTKAYEKAFNVALARKGALLLLPEYHLDRDKLQHQLKRCVEQLAEVIVKNNLTVVRCEQREYRDLGFDDGVNIVGYIDMLLNDAAGRPVIFDLKWTSKKDKYQNIVKGNRAIQLAMYQAMMQAHELHPHSIRTAFFVMPQGKIISSDNFADCHFEKVSRKTTDDIMEMLRKGYTERRREISDGRIETSDLVPITEIEYANVEGVFPLEKEGMRNPKKTENKYSDYKCFTL